MYQIWWVHIHQCYYKPHTELHPIIWNEKLKANRSQNVVLNMFGSRDGKSMVLKDYSFCVKNPKSGCNLYLTDFAVPVICVPLKECNLDIVEASFPAFKDLDFSDIRTNDRQIDLLIGMD